MAMLQFYVVDNLWKGTLDIHHFRSLHTIGVAGKILHFSGSDKLAARLRSFYYYRAKRGSRSVYGGSVSGRTGADYQTFCMSTHSAYILS